MNESENYPRRCCFTGHRYLYVSSIPQITKKLEAVLQSLIARGVSEFACGGALGFDMLAGYAVLELKRRFPHIRLVLILPCRNQDARWPNQERERYRNLLAKADEVKYVAADYHEGCMAQRNRSLVNFGDICVAYLKRPKSGTAQTVHMAQAHGLEIIHIGPLT